MEGISIEGNTYSFLPSYFITFFYYLYSSVYLFQSHLYSVNTIQMAHFCVSFSNFLFNDATFVPWHWPCWEYLHYNNQKMLHNDVTKCYIAFFYVSVFCGLCKVKRVEKMFIKKTELKSLLLSLAVALWLNLKVCLGL